MRYVLIVHPEITTGIILVPDHSYFAHSIIVGLFPGYHPVDAYYLYVIYSCCFIDNRRFRHADFVCCTCSHHDNADR